MKIQTFVETSLAVFLSIAILESMVYSQRNIESLWIYLLHILTSTANKHRPDSWFGNVEREDLVVGSVIALEE